MMDKKSIPVLPAVQEVHESDGPCVSAAERLSCAAYQPIDAVAFSRDELLSRATAGTLPADIVAVM